MKLYKTTEKLISENYPYGFRLKTTKTDWLEFDSKRGFRVCSQTIDPRTGKENKPKKSTYDQIVVLGKDENNHTKALHFEFYDSESNQRTIDFLKVQENFDLFTSEQIKYIYARFLSHIKVSMIASVQYSGAKIEDLKPLYSQAIDLIINGIKSEGKENYFNKISLDWDKIKACKDDNFSPFKVKTYGA